MSFVHPLLLGGLVLIGVPILLHLIMRQKPKHLLFPAFRFLLQKHRSNQRRLRLRHLLLLLLRILIVAFVCLALAQPRIFNERFNLATDRPVAAVLILDTSPSMEYAQGRSRLDEAKRRAQELLAELPAESKVAVLDTGDLASGQWLTGPGSAVEQVSALQIRPANSPVNGAVMQQAYNLLRELPPLAGDARDEPPRFVFIFSDRTAASWDERRVATLQEARKKLDPLVVKEVFFDVGVDKPADLAISDVTLPLQSVPANTPIALDVTVQATGHEFDTELICRIDGDERTTERRAVQLGGGQSQVYRFERSGLAEGFHQAEITLASADSLPFNNKAFATFEVRGPRQVLVICDNPGEAVPLASALRHFFKVDVQPTADARKLSPRELAPYQAICLLGLVRPDMGLWEALEEYVKGGGGLAVVPGGEDMDDEAGRDAYNMSAAAQRLLPARLVKLAAVDPKAEALWKPATYEHPATARFRDWLRRPETDFVKFPPRVFRFWELEPVADRQVLAIHTTNPETPAILERALDQGQYRGRVLLFASPLSRRFLAAEGPNRWHDFLQTSFFLVLANEMVGYLAGATDRPVYNFRSGQEASMSVPAEPWIPTYTLAGPGLESADTVVTRQAGETKLTLRQAVVPGNYKFEGGEGQWRAGFSLMVWPAESQLAKVPEEEIARLFEAGSVIPITQTLSFREVLQAHWPQPVDLLPWLMLAVLLVLAIENLLANKFYRRAEAEPDGGR